MVICLERGADLHTAQLMPLPLTVSCFSKIQIGFTFLVPAHPGSPGKTAVKRVCVCACVRACVRACVCVCVCVYLPRCKPLPGCVELLELLETLEISLNLKLLLEILEVSWDLVDAPGRFYNWQCNFCMSHDF